MQKILLRNLQPARIQRSVMGRWSTHVTLLMLLIGLVSADPDTLSRSNCEHQSGLHNRMEAVEKRLEDAVQKLDTELSFLLDAIEAPEWRPLLGPDSGAPLIDILDESEAGAS